MDIPKADKPAEEAPLEPWQATPVIMNNLLLVESYSRNVGRPLLEGEVELTEIAQELWEAPFALLSHEQLEESSEPVFSYANKARAPEMQPCKSVDFIRGHGAIG